MLPEKGIIITPSNINAWRQTRGRDELFTWLQLHHMPTYNLDPATCDYVIVRSPIGMQEMWWPACDPKPVYLLPCPIIPTVDGEERADGRVLVLSPAGIKKLVYPDGSITGRKPKKKPAWRERLDAAQRARGEAA